MGPQSERVWRAMHCLTRAKVRASGLPLLESGQLITHQGTFGEQITAALSAGWAQGYDRLICIGNDCPDLSVTDLRRAAAALDNQQTPVGADRRGGVYLFGLSRAQFDADAFKNLDWHTDRLVAQIKALFTGNQSVTVHLSPKTDLNSRADAGSVRWSESGTCRLLNAVRQLCLPTAAPVFGPVASRWRLVVLPFRTGRAPPIPG